jgi:hypothetical protein
MHGENGLRLFRLDRHKAHVRPAHGFADGLGIIGVVLAALAVGGDELGRHQSGIVAQLDQFPCPVVGAGTGLDADQADRRIGEEGEHLAAGEGFLENGLALLIDAVDLENRLGDIKTDADNFHGTPPWLASQPLGCNALSVPLDGRGSPFH